MHGQVTDSSIYPFAAIVGQSQMTLALILNAVNPAIGGLLIRGHKGTAKSTAVRGLARLLTNHNGYPPLTEMPLGATEDMVVGAMDMEAAIQQGKATFQPGILSRANGGLLYVDEVNLLDDHLVECIMDAAESGVNRVEREGVCASHSARFSLVGSMNPEEGELRPQLLDRFGLSVQVQGESDVAMRVELMRRRERFDNNGDVFAADFQEKSWALSRKIAWAKKQLSHVTIPSHLLTFIAEIAEVNNVAGHRADIIIERAARANAAWSGRESVTVEDIQEVAPMALLHRSREQAPPQMPPPKSDTLDNGADNRQDENTASPPNDSPQPRGAGDDAMEPAPSTGNCDTAETETDVSTSETHESGESNETSQKAPDREDTQSEQTVFEVGSPWRVKPIMTQKDRLLRTGSGRRSRSRSANRQGRYIRSTSQRRNGDLALDATLRAAAPFQKNRKKMTKSLVAVHVRDGDIREKVRERRMGNILVFAVDGSGSMGAQKRMVETKAAVLSLLMDAYQKRDKVAVIVFRGLDAMIVLPPTNSVELASRMLTDMPIGGRTPLSAGLGMVAKLLDQVARKNPLDRPITLFLTDGKANAALGEGPAHLEALSIAARMAERYSHVRFIVMDTEPPGAIRLRMAQKLATALCADYFEPESLRANEIVNAIKENS